MKLLTNSCAGSVSQSNLPYLRIHGYQFAKHRAEGWKLGNAHWKRSDAHSFPLFSGSTLHTQVLCVSMLELRALLLWGNNRDGVAWPASTGGCSSWGLCKLSKDSVSKGEGWICFWNWTWAKKSGSIATDASAYTNCFYSTWCKYCGCSWASKESFLILWINHQGLGYLEVMWPVWTACCPLKGTTDIGSVCCFIWF